MIRKIAALSLSSIIFFFISGVAFAHTGLYVSGLDAGLMHPLDGADHLLAMMAVGLWAAQNGGRKILLLPATFMLSLAIGANIAIAYPSLPLVELVIAVSVLMLGVFTTLSLKLPVLLCVTITGCFGFLHGYVHGLEMPDATEPAAYAAGFVSTTFALHLTGILIGMIARRRFDRLARVLGTTIAASGLWMLFQL